MNLFESNIRNIYREKGEKWLESLPNLTQAISLKLNLTKLQPFANLSHNYVLSGFQGGRPIILKLGLDIEALSREALALQCFENYGTAKLLLKDEGLLLIERAEPAISLKTYLADRKGEAINIACNLMKRLHQSEVQVKHSFPNIRDWLSTLDRAWNIPDPYLLKARQMRTRLLANVVQEVLLHGDLHHDNIIQNGNDWMVIDPKGVIGPPIFESWAFVINIVEDTEYIANFFKFDLQQVRDWYFICLIMFICWHQEDNTDYSSFMALAQKAYYLTSM